MTERVDNYFTVLGESLRCRKAMNIERADELLDQLDGLWYSMSTEEKEQVNARQATFKA